MSLSRIIHSCSRSQDYPCNLPEAGRLYPSVLREYQQRLTRRAEQLFCKEGRAAVELFQYEESQNRFTSQGARDLPHLRQYLPCATGITQEDKWCSFIFVGAASSRDELQISHAMTLWILSFLQALPSFLEFIFPFGRRLYDIDFQFCGFRQDNRVESAFQREAVPELRRSGQDYQICYNLKTVEPKANQASWPWSCRQTAVFHSFDVKNGHASWMVIKANDVVKDRLKEISEDCLQRDPDIYKSVPKMFANTLESHVALVEWSGDNWRWYINYFEEQLHDLKRRAIVDKVPSSVNKTTTSTTTPLYAQSGTLSTKRTWSWRGAFSRTNTTNTTNTQAPAPIPMQSQLPLPMSMSVPGDPPELPPDLPPEYNSISGQKSTDHGDHEYKIDELQRAQNIESNASEAILVLRSNIRILSHLRSYYEQLPNSRDLDQGLAQSMQTSVCSFRERIELIQSDLQNHLDRLETVAKLTAECRNLLYGIVEYQSMQANKMFAQEAQRSAERMEGMTRKMQELTLKTTLETVLMRIITVVTVFFLPATFVSTLMSTDIVHFEPQNLGISSGKASLGAIKLFICLTFSLMFGTFAAGFGLYWWAVRYADH